jgi:hypothetical protein
VDLLLHPADDYGLQGQRLEDVVAIFRQVPRPERG